MEDNFAKILSKRITALKKFTRKDVPYSNYINEKFYTNQHILIMDSAFMRFSDEARILDKKNQYSTFLEFDKIKEKLSNYDYDSCCIKKIPKAEFKDFVKNLKRMTMEQIKINPDGSFRIYDQYGYPKWNIEGQCEIFEDINFECDNKLFQNVLNYLLEIGSEEVTIKSNKEFMAISNDGGVKIFICGVMLAEYEYKLWK